MKHTATTTHIITGIALLAMLCSCNGNSTSTTTTTKCADTLAKTSVTDTSLNTADSLKVAEGMPGISYEDTASMETETSNTTKKPHHAAKKRPVGYMEPTGPMTLKVASSAFANNGVIPVKYTCDGQGATPPLNITNIPPGTKSLTLIVHDYNATPLGGFTYWVIWNLDTLGVITENFRNGHESLNAAREYGYTPICAKSGNHKYHFIVYAIDTRLLMGKNTTKKIIEKVMKDHILAKGELVGVYNRQLE